MTIDVEKLRETLKQECYGAFFGGGFGGALVESFDLEGASPEETVAVALDKEIDLSKYQTQPTSAGQRINRADLTERRLRDK